VDELAVVGLDDDRPAVDVDDCALVAERLDLVADLERPPGLNDDAGREVVGDPIGVSRLPQLHTLPAVRCRLVR
jgi:hypothetical protein